MLRKYFITSLFSCCLLLLTTVYAYAGAWSMGKGKSYNRMALNYYEAQKQYDLDGNRKDMPWDGEFTDYNVNYYLEYGFTHRLTGIFSIFYKDISQEDDYLKYNNKGIGDIGYGVKYRIAQEDWGVFSVQGLLKAPGFYAEDDALPLGNGQYDFEMRALYGRSLWPVLPGYVNMEAGYRLRTEEPADEFRYLLEAGTDLGSVAYARVKLDGILGLDNGDDSADFLGNPTNTYEYDLTKLDVTVGVKIDEAWSVEAQYTQALWGENTASGATYALALTWQP